MYLFIRRLALACQSRRCGLQQIEKTPPEICNNAAAQWRQSGRGGRPTSRSPAPAATQQSGSGGPARSERATRVGASAYANAEENGHVTGPVSQASRRGRGVRVRCMHGSAMHAQDTPPPPPLPSDTPPPPPPPPATRPRPYPRTNPPAGTTCAERLLGATGTASARRVRHQRLPEQRRSVPGRTP